jgi:hypothetical protein
MMGCPVRGERGRLAIEVYLEILVRVAVDFITFLFEQRGT